MPRDKLVRDRIPDIIRSRGEPCKLDEHYRKAAPEEMHELLLAKLREEVEEYAQSDDPTELIDVYEVLRHLVTYHGIEKLEFDLRVAEKLRDRGGFWDRWVLFMKE